MDDSKFLGVFSRLQSRDKTVLRDSIQQLLDFLSKAGGRSEERDYALTRLTKGLASALHEVKVGYSMAVTAMLRTFPDIDPLALYRSYKALDQSISSAHSLRLGQVTLIACCMRGRPGFHNKEVEKDLLDLFRAKRETAEAASEVILLSPQAHSIIGKIEDQSDVNYLRLAYEKQGTGVISQAVKAKTTILEGTLGTLPRLHSVWTPILAAAYQSGK